MVGFFNLSESGMVVTFGMNEDSIKAKMFESLPLFSICCTSCNWISNQSMVGRINVGMFTY